MATVGRKQNRPQNRPRQMRFAALATVGLFLLAPFAAAATAPDAGRFDGLWGVTLVCPKAPDGALPFHFEFTANVRQSVLHGERGLAGRPGWLSLDGRIAPDGAASLEATGLTGQFQYNLNSTESGVSYHYPVTAHFDTMQGTGSWVTSRTCVFSFKHL